MTDFYPKNQPRLADVGENPAAEHMVFGYIVATAAVIVASGLKFFGIWPFVLAPWWLITLPTWLPIALAAVGVVGFTLYSFWATRRHKARFLD